MTLLKKLMLGAVALAALVTATPAQAYWHHDRETVVVEHPRHFHHHYFHRDTTIAVTGHRHHVLIER